MVVLYSEIFDLLEEEREDELLFVLAHEFAHLKRRHVLVHLLLLPAMFIPFLGEAYLRACEYTCDRYAAFYVGSLDTAKEALSILAIGKKLSSKMNKEAYVQQISEESGFFAWLSEKLSSHPDLPKRINSLDNWANPTQYSLIREKKTRIILGVSASLVILSILGTLLVKGIPTIITFFEDPYLYDDSEYYYEEDVLEYPPIIQAYMDDDMVLFQQLVEEGTAIDEKDMDGYTALHYAVTWEDLETAEYLIQSGADVNTLDNWGSTPLMNAVYNQASVEMVTLLLEYGADKTIMDSEGKTAYDYAVDNRDAELRNILK